MTLFPVPLERPPVCGPNHRVAGVAGPEGGVHEDGGLALQEGLDGGVGVRVEGLEGGGAVESTHGVRHHVRHGLAHDQVSGRLLGHLGVPLDDLSVDGSAHVERVNLPPRTLRDGGVVAGGLVREDGVAVHRHNDLGSVGKLDQLPGLIVVDLHLGRAHRHRSRVGEGGVANVELVRPLDDEVPEARETTGGPDGVGADEESCFGDVVVLVGRGDRDHHHRVGGAGGSGGGDGGLGGRPVVHRRPGAGRDESAPRHVERPAVGHTAVAGGAVPFRARGARRVPGDGHRAGPGRARRVERGDGRVLDAGHDGIARRPDAGLSGHGPRRRRVHHQTGSGGGDRAVGLGLPGPDAEGRVGVVGRQ